MKQGKRPILLQLLEAWREAIVIRVRECQDRCQNFQLKDSFEPQIVVRTIFFRFRNNGFHRFGDSDDLTLALFGHFQSISNCQTRDRLISIVKSSNSSAAFVSSINFLLHVH